MTPPAYRVFALDDDDARGALLGGSADVVTAVAIACAVYQQLQQGGGSWEGNRVAVYDETDAQVAYIGGPLVSPEA